MPVAEVVPEAEWEGRRLRAGTYPLQVQCVSSHLLPRCRKYTLIVRCPWVFVCLFINSPSEEENGRSETPPMFVMPRKKGRSTKYQANIKQNPIDLTIKGVRPTGLGIVNE